MTEERKITTIFSVNIDSNMQMMNSPGISPPMDAIQKFKVAKNTGSEFARSASANINMAMKSGTSELHGPIYEFLIPQRNFLST